MPMPGQPGWPVTASPSLHPGLTQHPAIPGSAAAAWSCAAIALMMGATFAGGRPSARAICLGDRPWRRSTWTRWVSSSGFTPPSSRAPRWPGEGNGGTWPGPRVDHAGALLGASALPINPADGVTPMLPGLTLPPSLTTLLAAFQPLFTVPSFRTFCALAGGFWAQTGRRTVCGMLTGAGLSRVWRHDRAHRFFSHARWSAEDLGLALAKLAVTLLVPAGEPVLVAIDDTLFKRTGRTVHAIGWFHDGSAK